MINAMRSAFGKWYASATSDTAKLYREWDRQREKAMSPSERSEIDAIFARHI